jgi:hypothetical protein
VKDFKRPTSGVRPFNFIMSVSGKEPWFRRPEVNGEKLDQLADKYIDRNERDGKGALLRSGQDADISDGSGGASDSPSRMIQAGTRQSSILRPEPKSDSPAALPWLAGVRHCVSYFASARLSNRAWREFAWPKGKRRRKRARAVRYGGALTRYRLQFDIPLCWRL